MNTYVALLLKDLRLELRAREIVSVLLFLAAILALLASFGIESAFVDPATTARLFPGIFWGSFVVIASISAGRAFEADFETRAIDGLFLARVNPALLFLAKFSALTLIFIFGALFLLLVESVFLNVALVAVLGFFVVLLLAVILPYAALLTVLSALSATSRLRGFLLPVISLPLTVPLFLAAIELSGELMSTGQFNAASPWLTLLGIMFVVYGVVGINVFGAVIRE